VHFGEVGVVYVRAYGWFVAALIWSLVLLVAAIRFT
jgi:ATP/ADP translocase